MSITRNFFSPFSCCCRPATDQTQPFSYADCIQQKPCHNLLDAVTMCLNPENSDTEYNYNVQPIPEVSIVATVPDENETLEHILAALVNQNISDETIKFLRYTINNETNKITKQTIVDNLQRYAEICGYLKNIRTFEVIKDQFQKLSNLNNDVLSVIQTQLSEPLPVSCSENAHHIVDNRKQLQNVAYLILVSEQLSNAGINVPPPLITQILNYVEQHQAQTECVGVIIDNLPWYALACHYCDSKGQLPEHVQVATFPDRPEFPDFQSAQDLLDCTDYTKLTQYFTIYKPETAPTERTTKKHISHSECVAQILTNPIETPPSFSFQL